MGIKTTMAAACAVLLMGAPGALAQQDHPMGVCVTSVGVYYGGNLGEPAGANGHCGKLADAAGLLYCFAK